jgi:hypothetical protein
VLIYILASSLDFHTLILELSSFRETYGLKPPLDKVNCQGHSGVVARMLARAMHAHTRVRHFLSRSRDRLEAPSESFFDLSSAVKEPDHRVRLNVGFRSDL